MPNLDKKGYLYREYNRESLKNIKPNKKEDGGRKLSFFHKFKVLFSGATAIVGTGFLLIGSIVFIAFAFTVDFSDLKFYGKTQTTNGKITEVVGTNSYYNEVQVQEYHFSYSVDGKKYESKSYKAAYIDKLQPVEIEYVAANPQVARIVGTKLGQFPLWILLFIAIFPIIGSSLVAVRLKQGLKEIEILKYGKVGFGRFLRMEATGSSVNNSRVYNLFFEFEADGKTYEAKGTTHLINRLKDEILEPLVYMPDDPSQAVMIDAMPKSMRKFFADEIEVIKL